ncbi:hypothetical protein E4631_07645 [Hymenobacter sp. UV11]|uniref:hypothetical protein n=1 Tax=Hymenobacter sp. UV11 TaxID=1849735 RepID=UPI0010600B13|nr:hypothetical protein [Hymenobacter sp. UV11]TDN36141.1 hypothetical protein A8B98_09355 [Hymenobacter sp. UV11]TFZ66835.1 hypothetical protein E4631_07645 [Hymenobacter sp. UV11]
MSPKPRSLNFLALLLGGALVLSLVFNGFLLYSRPAVAGDFDDLQETEADLRMTQKLLAHCQADHQRQDSLLALRPPASAALPTAAVPSQ